MSDEATWQQHNEAYLAAALKWLRLLLTFHAPSAPPAALAAAEATGAEGTSGWFQRRKPEAAAQPALPPLLPAPPPVTAADVAAAAGELRAAEQADPPPALVILSRQLGLSRFEQQTLLLCAAVELDTRIPALCARAQDDASRPFPTFALALAVLEQPAWDALSPERPLRRLHLLEISQPAGTPLTASALRADERIVNAIKGLHYLDDRLAPLITPIERPSQALPPSQQTVAQAALNALRQADALGQPLVVQLTGPEDGSKAQIASTVVAALDPPHFLYRLAIESLPAQPAEIETLARLWQREALLLPVALYVDAHDADPAQGGESARASSLSRFLARTGGMVFLDTREPWPGLEAAVLDVENPTPPEQQAIWAAELGPDGDDIPALLAGSFNLDGVAIQRIARAELATDARAEPLSDRLWSACLAGTRPRMDALAQRLDARATWQQIVLTDEALGLLRQIADQVRQRSKVYDDWGFRARMNRGLGISALFAGNSGTGKTMAAEVIANELRLDLYRIDLSAVVSKYIGETEKNLRKLFDAAEDGGAILFFDEADALFGKRSEVKDSHDRYANIEINYLLQRMEAYRGLAILATNMRGSLDTAFVRRLRFIIEFDFPSVAEREAIWRKIFPPELPRAELDYERLAQLSLSGGNIQNIALNAAFQAAASQPPRVTMALILAAARAEFRKLERPISEADFVWTE